jgi:outer membrane protein TolC
METNEPAVKREPAEVSTWWTVFHDPVLNTLVETAYRQNPPLRAAGVRVLEAQAASLLQNTQAQIPALETTIRQTQDTLCTLLGIPPQDLQPLLGGQQTIPTPPAEVAIGIPADLLRRRPDIRRAERTLAAQSAQIGVATADLLPSFTLLGAVSLSAENFSDLFKPTSFENFGGPTFR